MSGEAKDVKLLIAVASGRGWASRFGYSLAGLMLNLGLNRLHGRLKDLQLVVTSQAYLVTARQEHLEKAINEGFTHFLSLDDDMTFPGDIVERFLKNEDKPILTCNYRKKVIERVDYVCTGLDGQMVDSSDKTGLEEIQAMGMGMTFVNIAAVKDIPAPHFAVLYNTKTKKFEIEDSIFSHVLRSHGLSIWCDHDLSREIGHVGEVEYRLPELIMNKDTN